MNGVIAGGLSLKGFFRPVNHVLAASEIAAGLISAVSFLAAIHRRTTTGKGGEIRAPWPNHAFSILSALGNIGEVATADEQVHMVSGALQKDLRLSGANPIFDPIRAQKPISPPDIWGILSGLDRVPCGRRRGSTQYR